MNAADGSRVGAARRASNLPGEESTAGCRVPASPCGRPLTRGSEDGAMSDEAKVSKRGDAAWREARDQVASRNDEARRAGKALRKAADERKVAARHAAEREQMDQMAAKARRT